MRDYIVKEMFGEHAISAIGKLVMMGAHRATGDANEYGGATAIAGVIIPDLVPDTGQHEMWECEIIIIPRRKYRGFDVPNCRLDQLLASNYGNPERWAEKVFEVEEDA